MKDNTSKTAFLIILAVGIVFNAWFVVFKSYPFLAKRVKSAFFGKTGASATKTLDGDFRQFLNGARMIKEGNPGIYHQKGPTGRRLITYTYPPTTYTLFTPFTLMDEKKAANLWLVIKVILCILTALSLAGVLKKAGTAQDRHYHWKLTAIGVLIIIAIASFSPTWEEIYYGQVNLAILFLLAVSILLTEKAPSLAGVLLGLVLCFKIVSALIIIYYAFRKRWKIAGWAMATALGISLITTARTGPGIFINYIATVGSSIQPWTMHFHSQSTVSFIRSISGAPAETAGLISTIISMIVVAVSFAALKKAEKPSPLAVFSTLVTCTLLISPIVWPQHHVWLFLPFIYIFKALIQKNEWHTMENVEAVYLLVIFLSLGALDGSDIFLGLNYQVRKAFLSFKIPFYLTAVLWAMTLFIATRSCLKGKSRQRPTHRKL